ncbi:MAG: permease [Bacillota bacterium]
MKLLKRYRFFLATVAVTFAIFLLNRPLGIKAAQTTVYSLKEMALVIPPVFVLLGLLDVWVPKEMMMRLMGEKSGLLGIVLAIILGSAAAGPLYGAFPVAAVFMRKGVKFANILIFIGAWSTTKIPMLLFEMSALGAKFALTRLAVDIPGIILIGYILQSLIPAKDVEKLYKAAESL